MQLTGRKCGSLLYRVVSVPSSGERLVKLLFDDRERLPADGFSTLFGRTSREAAVKFALLLVRRGFSTLFGRTSREAAPVSQYGAGRILELISKFGQRTRE